nr:malonate decarboxylase holo-ACP synthase [Turicimonas muris]
MGLTISSDSFIIDGMNLKAFLPHDLLFLRPQILLPNEAPAWAQNSIKEGLPCVVRRDAVSLEKIPVGFRGTMRSQRYSLRKLSPEDTAVFLQSTSLKSPQLDYLKDFSEFIQANEKLKNSVKWGISGSFGFSLAVGRKYFRDTSDIDLVIRANNEEELNHLASLKSWILNPKFQLDIQIQTSKGGFSYKEWLRTKKVLLKTNTGPLLTDNPW